MSTSWLVYIARRVCIHSSMRKSRLNVASRDAMIMFEKRPHIIQTEGTSRGHLFIFLFPGTIPRWSWQTLIYQTTTFSSTKRNMYYSLHSNIRRYHSQDSELSPNSVSLHSALLQGNLLAFCLFWYTWAFCADGLLSWPNL